MTNFQRCPTSDHNWTIRLLTMYEQRIDLLRRLVAIAFGVCGAGLVICANRRAHLDPYSIQSAELWQRGAYLFGIGLIALFTITLLLVIEGIARFFSQKSGMLNSISV